MSCQTLPFLDVFKDASGGNVKTPQKEFLDAGDIPVVDQGKSLIAGFVNDRSRVCHAKPPVIVFGDHTRAVKYVDFEFAMGADGTKVLVPKIESDTKYLYYALSAIEIPSAGYSRHYKFLKETTIPIPPLAEQKRIAGILDAADALRAKRRESLAQLDTLLQSTFLDMFGDPVTNPMGWEVGTIEQVGAVQGGLQVSSKRRSLPIGRPYLRVANVMRGYLDLEKIKTIRVTEAEARRTELADEDVLFVEGHGNRDEIGRCARWDGSIKPCVHQNHLIRLRCDRSKVLPVYVESYMNSDGGRRSLVGASRTTSGLNTISVSKVKATALATPPLSVQERFAAIVDSVQQQKADQRAHLAELDTLFASLQSRAFRGDL